MYFFYKYDDLSLNFIIQVKIQFLIGRVGEVDGYVVRLIEGFCFKIYDGKRFCFKVMMLREIEDNWYFFQKLFYIVVII